MRRNKLHAPTFFCVGFALYANHSLKNVGEKGRTLTTFASGGSRKRSQGASESSSELALTANRPFAADSYCPESQTRSPFSATFFCVGFALYANRSLKNVGEKCCSLPVVARSEPHLRRG